MTEYGKEFKQVYESYKNKDGTNRYKQGDIKAEYRSSWMDSDGVEYFCYGAEVGKKKEILYAKVQRG